MAKQNLKWRAMWLRRVETLVVDDRPEMAGRMDWDTAIHLWNIGTDAPTAAAKLVAIADKESE